MGEDLRDTPHGAAGRARAVRWMVSGSSEPVGGFVLDAGTVTILLATGPADDGFVEAAAGQGGVARPPGDGPGPMVAAFPRAIDAVHAALEFRLAERDGPAGCLLIHTGEVQVHGLATDAEALVERASWLIELGHPGQVLLSQAARDLVLDDLPEGWALVDLGTHRARDLRRAEHLYELSPGEETTFPSLNSLDSFPHNLPVQLSSFVGRRRELADLARQVRSAHLVTLTGSGGCGKTRLALQLGAESLDDFPDGVWLVDLSPVTEPEMVASAVTAALGLPDRPALSPTDLLIAHLSGRRALVVLDNCEHVVGACAELVDLVLRQAPHTVVVATSREPLGVDGEVTWRVPSLPVPARASAEPIESLTTYDAVALFIDRATRARPNFTVDVVTAPAIAEICVRLDGIPLAIELAAARVRVMTVEQVASGLVDRFRLLGGGARTALPRQQTLQASVAWSHDLLTETQKAVLHRVAVFTGSFSLAAAEIVVAGDGIAPADVLELLSQLVDRSLVVLEVAGPLPRYRLLETIRHFGRDRLVEEGAAAAVKTKHLEWYVRWAEDRRSHASDTDQLAMLAGFDAEIDNVRAALDWALADDHIELGVRLAAALEHYWVVTSHYREGRRWLESLLAGEPDLALPVRVAAMNVLAHTCSAAWDIPTAMYLAAQALPLAREAGVPSLLAESLWGLGMWMVNVDFDAGVALLEECVAVARGAGDDGNLAIGLQLLGGVLHGRGELARAGAVLQEGVRVAAVPGREVQLAYVGMNYANWLGAMGRFDEAVTVAESALDTFTRTNNALYACSTLYALARWAVSTGDIAGATAHLETARVVSRQPGLEHLAGTVSRIEAHVLVATAEFAAADELLAQIESSDARTNIDRTAVLQVRLLRLVCAFGRGDVMEALEGARALVGELGPEGQVWAPSAYLLLARAARAGQEFTEAEAAAHRALAIAPEIDPTVTPSVVALFAALRADVGAWRDAARLFAAAESLAAPMRLVVFHAFNQAAGDIARTKEALGDDEFARAWEEGQALDLDGVMAYLSRGRGARRRPSSGWDSLTPTESSVVALVAVGMTNTQIAAELFMSPRTVSTHVSHVFQKLGLTSRVELAAEATRRGLGQQLG